MLTVISTKIMKEWKFLTPWQLAPFHFILDPFHHLPGYPVVFHCFVPVWMKQWLNGITLLPSTKKK